jgi:hypothetical protein
MGMLIRINLMKGGVNIKTEWNSFWRLMKGMVLGTNADKKIVIVFIYYDFARRIIKG